MLASVAGSVADAWSGASYERIAATFAPIHDRVVAELAIEPGERVLDVACGTGAVALRAARLGADVVGTDISGDQLAKARLAAEAEGLFLRLDEADCQELPYLAAEFDVVVSVFGVIFAADHERAAAELARVCRPGGRLALTAWPDDGWSRTHARAGWEASHDREARRWSEEAHLRALLDGPFELELKAGEWRVEAESPEALWAMLSTSVPPLRAWLAGLDEDGRRRAEDVYREFLAPGVLRREYVLVLGRRR
jgi:SAM-dependent methyltransferase